ncbi:MAG: bifunctional biotin--[acetyl-CoA-carboxylase] synthetase/biotin operon repressor [Rhodospirillales bacterium]|nr:bifunctional biotin--[acetyl-CoA-carboxylase] synthetase/biotin operon repressor [Rhodospirillales bacterium]
MRRADRLFRIVQALRGGRLVTAQQLAHRLEVSDRTIYRDVRDLMLSGVPIEGEAGVGYVLRRGFDLPPLMFERHEIEALVLGARMVQAWGGVGLAQAAQEALQKIAAVAPPALAERFERILLYAPGYKMPPALRRRFDEVRAALDGRNLVELAYQAKDGSKSQRRIRPLGLYFWGGVWTLAAWCELRNDFRTFRLDLITGFDPLDQVFRPEPGRTLADLMARVDLPAGAEEPAR